MLYTLLRSLVWVLMHLAYALFGGIRFEGRENVPRSGGVLIAPNHISNVDPPTVGLALPRPCYFMANDYLFKIRFVGPLIRLLHAFPIRPGLADRVALRQAETLLQQGEVVVIFPEGRLSEDGQLLPIHPGVLLVAERAGVPIIPTAILHTDQLMPYGKVTPRFLKEKVIVRFGLPVTVAALKATNGEEEESGRSNRLKLATKRLSTLMQRLQEMR